MAVRRKQEGPEITALDGTVAATIADSTGAISIGSGGTNWTLPTTRGAEDYHLATNSPCIDAGKVTSITDDLDGISRDPSPDIGCYELN